MSHIAKIELEIKSLSALESAAKRLGMELARDRKTYRWYGRSVGDYPLPQGFKTEDLGKCDHVLRIPNNSNAYEIGVVKNKDGKPGYTLLWDFWNGGYGLVDKVGKDGTKLKQEYGYALTSAHYTQQGYQVTRQTKGDGTVVLTATK